MARIVIEDLDHASELLDADLNSVVGGGEAHNAPSVRVADLLPQTVFPAIGSGTLGL